jgi:hypothetical protein
MEGGRTLQIEHVLYLPAEAASDAVAEKLRAAAYAVSVTPMPNNEPPEWELRATRAGLVTEERMAAEREWLERLVEPSGGDYDGWDAKPMVP